jgi:hypothetical protein
MVKAMRVSPTLLLAVAVACAPSGARAEDPAKIDPSQQVNALNPSPDTTKTEEKVGIKHEENLQGKRATIPGVIQEPMSPLNGATAPIDVTETHPKNIVPRKDAAISTTPLPRKDSNLNGQTAPDELQPKANLFSGSGIVAEKFQQRLTDANTANVRLSPELQKTTSFGELNRFVFRHNGPGRFRCPETARAWSPQQAAARRRSRKRRLPPPRGPRLQRPPAARLRCWA